MRLASFRKIAAASGGVPAEFRVISWPSLLRFRKGPPPFSLDQLDRRMLMRENFLTVNSQLENS
jgi:hypothetical protein